MTAPPADRRQGPLPVLLAVTGEPWEADLVSVLERGAPALHVVRRCVDVTELLAAGASGTAVAALVSAGLRRLDRDALARLRAAGVTVVGVVAPGDEDAERRLRQLGVAPVTSADVGGSALSAVVEAAVGGARGVTDPLAEAVLGPLAGAEAAPAAGAGPAPAPPLPSDGRRGRLVAVWGPTGAPGRTTVAVNLAAELAGRGARTLLADADTYGGVVAQVLGLLDEAPGLAAAVRLAGSGGLDLPALAGTAPVTAGGLRVLTGVARADRWPEIRPAALETVWEQARLLADVTVADTGFCLEQDEELVFDTGAPRRNGATLTTLEAADVVVAVCAADPVGTQRFVRAVTQLRELVPDSKVVVVLNRCRRAAVGPEPERQLAEALRRYLGVEPRVAVPEDRDTLDRALLRGLTVREAAPGSPVAQALARLADVVLPEERASGGRARRGPRQRRLSRRRAA